MPSPSRPLLLSSGATHFDIGKFNRDGYQVIHNFLPPETVALLRQRVLQLLDDFSLEGHPMTKFSTGEKEAHVGDEVLLPHCVVDFEYFLTSGDKIRYFLEEEAVNSAGNLVRPKERAVNKIGHGIY
jgi:phytanoyl-CoA hydroxylase